MLTRPLIRLAALLRVARAGTAFASLTRAALPVAALAAVALAALPGAALAQEDLNDLEMVHVAVTASNIDIAYAEIALERSGNPEVRAFAQTMIRDHGAVNGQVAELAAELGVTAQDNELSQSLLEGAEATKAELRELSGDAFDRRYVENELAYHRTVNGVVADAFIPNVENGQVKAAFEGALQVFRGHERHAEELASDLTEEGQGQ